MQCCFMAGITSCALPFMYQQQCGKIYSGLLFTSSDLRGLKTNVILTLPRETQHWTSIFHFESHSYRVRRKQLLAKAFLESTSITQNEKSQNKGWFIERRNYLFLICTIHQVMHSLVIFHCLHHQFLDFILLPIFFLWCLFAPRWFITDLLQIHVYSSHVCVIMKILLQRMWERRNTI